MVASHSQNKSLERIGKILDFIEGQYKSNPTKETFQFAAGKLSSFDPLLEDADLLKMAFKKIATDTQENIKIEFRQGLPEQNTAVNFVTHELLLWLYVEDQNKFKEYRNSVKQEIERESRHVQFILDANGFFYKEGSNDKKHHFKSNSLRYQLLRLLADRKDFVTTQDLSRELEDMEASAEDIRGAVEEIRTIVARKMNLPRESIFENNSDGTGYRVMNVSVKES